MQILRLLVYMFLYLTLAGYSLLALCVIVGAFLRTRKRGRNLNGSITKQGPRTHFPEATVGFRQQAWANVWLPRNFETALTNDKVIGNTPDAAARIKKSIALVCIALALGIGSTVSAQETSAREDSTSALKQQLMEIELKQTQLRMRLQELDEQLKPEYIERSLAGIGSTHPEELREHRRKLLTIERDGLQAQLLFLEQSCERIVSAISAAETAEYLKRTQASPTPPAVTAPAKQMTQTVIVPNLQIAKSLFQPLFLAAAKLVLGTLATGLLIMFFIRLIQKFQSPTVSISKSVSASSSLQT
ncbi:MAG: hypothetical protein ACRD6N_08150, partial [Pyrinomonadaceae bacterium]